MSNRLAFAPLQSLETTLDLSIQQRARALFENAKARTARGSGHDLDKSIAGNNTAIASACLLLAKTESEGASMEDLDVHQRHAMVTKPQFKLLVSTLQSVLDLRSGAKTAFTPTRGSARKRKSETMEADNEPVTPTKSLRGKPPVEASTSTENGPSTPTHSSGRKSARLSTIALQLMSASHESSKAAKDEEMSPGADKTRVSRSSPRKSATRMDVPPEPSKTPTKSIRAKGKERASEAFEQAMAQKTPTKTKTAIKTTPGKPSVDYSKPYVAVKLEADVESKQEEEVPPETYWGDMLIRYRRKVDVEARQQKTEAWRQSMLRRLDLAL